MGFAFGFCCCTAQPADCLVFLDSFSRANNVRISRQPPEIGAGWSYDPLAPNPTDFDEIDGWEILNQTLTGTNPISAAPIFNPQGFFAVPGNVPIDPYGYVRFDISFNDPKYFFNIKRHR